MVPYHTIAFSQQKLRAALRRAAGQDPVVHLRLRGPLAAPERAALPRLDHTSWREPGFQRAAVERSGRPSALAVRPRPYHARAGHLDRAGKRKNQTGRPSAGLHADAHRNVRYHNRRHPASGTGRGGGKAESLVQPLLILTPTRPAAWPLGGGCRQKRPSERPASEGSGVGGVPAAYVPLTSSDPDRSTT